ncbi:hypothetical protein PRK78_000507 [Emydomyces testavorans]|uniref:Uncharacterized protein n=1 Tax=Emydomyces testavorans TaxID=2070801 RepID=A0AAF0IHP7_9EURO|nr:hypothetical protein PRK78_000507 [Emydomyces testavorans]
MGFASVHNLSPANHRGVLGRRMASGRRAVSLRHGEPLQAKREQKIYQSHHPPGIFDRVKAHDQIVDIPAHCGLTAEEKTFIESTVGSHYVTMYAEVQPELRTLLSNVEWVGFDLDDTLHEFRLASKAASLAVFEEIHKGHSAISVDALGSEYQAILIKATASAFSEGKTSTEYRKERFSALLHGQSIAFSESYLDDLVSLYKEALRSSLVLKPGTLDLLQKLKDMKKTVLVVTEAPRDAQKWMIDQLGLRDYVDILVTSNELRRSKTDGLFAEVLKRYELAASRGVYIGDNKARDVIPAQKEGILSIHYDETHNCVLNVKGRQISVNTLAKIGHLFDLAFNEQSDGFGSNADLEE